MQVNFDSPGVLFVRKRRGRKLEFMLGGPSFIEASTYINWKNVPDDVVVVWCPEGTIMREVERPAEFRRDQTQPVCALLRRQAE